MAETVNEDNEKILNRQELLIGIKKEKKKWKFKNVMTRQGDMLKTS